MKRKIEVYPNVENKDEYFVEGAKGEVSALMYLEIEYPEVKGRFKPKDAHMVFMSKCLDCETYWTNEDVCGDCGESRLSKRAKPAYFFYQH